jgi:hypothetical protein
MKKLSLLFLILVSVSLIFTPSCKTKDVFNITGLWNITISWTGYYTLPGTMTFTGSETSGNVFINVPSENTANGTYTVAGMSVTINATWGGGYQITMIGTAVNENNISGTFTQTNGVNGNFTANR